MKCAYAVIVVPRILASWIVHLCIRAVALKLQWVWDFTLTRVRVPFSTPEIFTPFAFLPLPVPSGVKSRCATDQYGISYSIIANFVNQPINRLANQSRKIS